MRYSGRPGFSLLDLIVVIAILGILAAVAVPNFIYSQARAKRAEIPVNVEGIRSAETAYNIAFDRWVNQRTAVPPTTPGRQLRSWPTGSDFDTLGWAPDGDVRGSYMVASLSTTDFRVLGVSDVDGDCWFASYTATRSLDTVYANLDSPDRY